MQEVTFTYEIIIHDDASTDGTAEIVKTYEERYPNIIKSMHQTENQYIEFYRRNRKIIDSLEKIPSAIKQPIESMIIHIATVY